MSSSSEAYRKLLTYLTPFTTHATYDPAPHPPVPLVDEVILEVAVNLRGQLLLGNVQLAPGGQQGYL